MKLTFHHSSGLTKFILAAEFLLVSYLLYVLTLNVYQSYKIDLYIKNFEKENVSIEQENKHKSQEYLYYTSDAYVEKIAKQNLGLVNPGEEVIVLSDPIGGADSIDSLPGYPEGEALKRYYHLSTPEKWWKFFFDGSV